jgi:hypothetical protein
MSTTPKLTTIFYKYNRYALVIIILYVLVFVTFFYYTTRMPMYATVTGFAILILPPIIAAIRNKSVFTIRRVDERRLTLTPAHIQIGDMQLAVADLKIALYIGGFDNFKYSKRRKWITQNTIDGDQNHLSVKLNGKVEDLQFFLRDYKSYESLCSVVDAWLSAGISIVIKEQFKRDFVRKQVEEYSKPIR